MRSLLCGLAIFLLSSVNSQIYFPAPRHDIGSILNIPNNVSEEESTSESNQFNLIDVLTNNHRENSISRGLTDFTFRLNKAIINRIGRDSTENIVLSPLSIAGSLSLLLLGSVGNTYDELAKTLGFFKDITGSPGLHKEFGLLLESIVTKNFSRGAKQNPNVTYGNAIFLQENFPIREQYERFVRTVYNGKIVHVNYKENSLDAQNTINRWASEATNGKITEVLSSPPPAQTRMIVASALYFMGEWEKFFPTEFTRRDSFYMDKRFPEQKVQVDLMATEGTFPYYKSLEHNCELVGLPYKGNNTFLYAIKPLNAEKKDLYQIINDITPETLNTLIKNAKAQSTIVTFPKMKLTSTTYLRSALEDMGTKSLFSRAHANLALLSPVYQPSPIPQGIKNEKQSQDDSAEQFIFTRIQEEMWSPVNTSCEEVFKSGSENTMCVTKEIVNGKIIDVTYKKLNGKIERSVHNIPTVDVKNARSKRESLEALNPGLYVDEVIHKIDMDITETGTEAAATTLAFITRDGRRPVFHANEPFMFLIRNEDTKFILFSAIINKPIPNYAV